MINCYPLRFDLSGQILKNLKELSFIESKGVPPRNTKSLKGHPYRWLDQVIPNYYHSEYGTLQYISGTSKQSVTEASARVCVDRSPSAIFDAVGPSWAKSSPFVVSNRGRLTTCGPLQVDILSTLHT